MKRIILLTGSRAGSHYLCTLYDSAYGLRHMPEILNANHWPGGKPYVPASEFDLTTAFNTIRKEESFIVKYYTGYELVSPSNLLDFAERENCEFYFLYRQSNIDTLISYMYMKFDGEVTEENLQVAADNVSYNNQEVRRTYELFQNRIKQILRYEDLTFTGTDLNLLGVSEQPGRIIKKEVSVEQHAALLGYNLEKYLDGPEFIL